MEGATAEGTEREDCREKPLRFGFFQEATWSRGDAPSAPSAAGPSVATRGQCRPRCQVGASEPCSPAQLGSLRGTQETKFGGFVLFCFCIICDCFNSIFRGFFFLIRILRKSKGSHIKLLPAEPYQACVSSFGRSSNSVPEQLRGRVQQNLGREMVRKVQRSPGRSGSRSSDLRPPFLTSRVI